MATTWAPINDGVDYTRDLVAGYWAEIGPAHGSGWTWAVLTTTDDRDMIVVACGDDATREDVQACVANWAAGWHRHAVVVLPWQDGRSAYRCRECCDFGHFATAESALMFALGHASGTVCESTWQARMRGELDFPDPL